MKVSGIRAVLAVKGAMEDAGLARTSTLSGGEVTGWIETNRMGSTGFSVAPVGQDVTRWHVVLSGEPHLRYRTFHDGEGTELREPENPQVLCPRIRRVFEGLGTNVREVSFSGSQGMWDDDVDYDVVTDRPDWLAVHDPSNGDVLSGDGPTLSVVRLTGASRDLGIHSRASLAAYVSQGKVMLTRESLEKLAEDVRVANEEGRRYRASTRGGLLSPFRAGLVKLRPDDTFVWHGAGERKARESRPVTITNHWGVEVQAWEVPSRMFEASPPLKADVEFLVSGRMTKEIAFAEWDAQFGDRAPWSRPEGASPTP